MFTVYSISQLSIIPQATQRPVKRLRLTVKRANFTGPTIQSLGLLLDSSAGGNPALQILLQISDNLVSNYDEDLTEPIRKLSEHFKREKESAVRVKVRVGATKIRLIN